MTQKHSFSTKIPIKRISHFPVPSVPRNLSLHFHFKIIKQDQAEFTALLYDYVRPACMLYYLHTRQQFQPLSADYSARFIFPTVSALSTKQKSVLSPTVSGGLSCWLTDHRQDWGTELFFSFQVQGVGRVPAAWRGSGLSGLSPHTHTRTLVSVLFIFHYFIFFFCLIQVDTAALNPVAGCFFVLKYFDLWSTLATRIFSFLSSLK